EMTPSGISGVSCSNSRWTRCGRARLRTTFTRLPCGFTSKLTGPPPSVGCWPSPGFCLLRATMPSMPSKPTRRSAPSFRVSSPGDDAGNHRAESRTEFAKQRIALGFADFLDDDLLRGLSADAAADSGFVHGLAGMCASDFARFAVDVDNDIGQFAIVLLGGRD